MHNVTAEYVKELVTEANKENYIKYKIRYNIDYKPKIKLLTKILKDSKMKAYQIEGLCYKANLYRAIICAFSEEESIEETENGITVKSPVYIQIYLLKKIKDIAVTEEGLTEEQVRIIREERKKPKRKRGEYKEGDYKKTINELATMLKISNRKVAEFCKREKI